MDQHSTLSDPAIPLDQRFGLTRLGAAVVALARPVEAARERPRRRLHRARRLPVAGRRQ